MGLLKRLFGDGNREMNEMNKVRRALNKMKAGMPDAVRAAHDHSSRHRKETLDSDECGCFYCGAIFSPNEIADWVDHDQTALCPKCGIDSIIGSQSGFPLTKDFLNEMNRYWF
jgi:hypothetical protein